MAKTICIVLGVVFLLAGLLGFIMPRLAGLHLSPAHNVIHIVSGAAALYFGLARSRSEARLFAITFGLVYVLLGITGFWLGTNDSIVQAEHGGQDVGMSESQVFRPIPGVLVFGKIDHILHLLLGAAFLAAGFVSKAPIEPLVEDQPEG